MIFLITLNVKNLALILLVLHIVCGCQNKKNRTDYAFVKSPYEKYGETKTKPIESKIAKVRRERIFGKNFHNKVSISISNEVDIADVLVDICKEVGINLILSEDIKISQKFIYTAKDKKIIEVIDDICDLLNLKYRIKDNTIFLEKDSPHFKTFSVSFLFATRNSKNDSHISTDISSHNTESKINNESQSVIASSSQIDFWKELEQNILFILRDNMKTINTRDTPEKLCVLHKQAGLISVFGTKKQHKQIKDYINKLKKFIFTQITIEAKIVEIELSDKYSNGIDWTLLRNIAKVPVKISLPFNQGSDFLDNSDLMTTSTEIGDSNAGAIIKALQIFGSVRVTSNPRITVLNNQPALLKVVKNQVFFQVKVSNTFGKSASVMKTTSSDIKTVPVGLVLRVQACAEGDRIILAISSVISRIDGFQKDPGVSLEAAKYNNKLSSNIPIVQYEEVDTWIRILNGETVILGGLIETSQSEHSHGLPGLAKSPLKNILGHTSKQSKKKELVIVIRASINQHHN